MKIKKNDTVVVLSGKDKGKQGKVLSTMPTVGKVLVEGVNMADCHVRATRQDQESGIIRKAIPMRASKVMLVCPKCGKATRGGHTLRGGEWYTKVRVRTGKHGCGEQF